MEFAKNDMWLLACTRDRQVLLFKRADATSFAFSLHKRLKEAHTRIIWALSWSHDDAYFATASRENKKSVKIWNGISGDENSISELSSEIPAGKVPCATSLQFFPEKVLDGSYALMIGLESGAMSIWIQRQEGWVSAYTFPSFLTHGLTVRRIRFGRTEAREDKKQYTVATCGNDHTVRIFGIQF